ncbi:MAG TPA: hypothetical protein VHL09_12380 [Dehalococcoidia bacterium]|nr:hypothetical protein [Dehalococcoidia bacterium]
MAQRADERDLMTPDSEALREATERPRPDSADVGQFATDANRSDPSGREGLATDSAVGAAYDEAAESVDEHQSQGRE